MTDYDLIERGSAVQAIVTDVLEQGIDLAKLMEAAEFYIYDEDANPNAFVDRILRAGHKMEFRGDQCFSAYAPDIGLTLYFVGREVNLVRQIRELLDTK